jgi:hypothetical protein
MLIEGGYAHSLKMLLDRSRAQQLRSAGCSLRLPVEPLERKAHLRARRIIVATLVLCCLTVFLASLAVIYLGDQYVTPALSEQRVPPTRSY